MEVGPWAGSSQDRSQWSSYLVVLHPHVGGLVSGVLDRRRLVPPAQRLGGKLPRGQVGGPLRLETHTHRSGVRTLWSLDQDRPMKTGDER